MDKDLIIVSHSKFRGNELTLSKRDIKAFDFELNGQLIHTEGGWQYILSLEKGDVYKKTSWFLSREHDTECSKEDFTHLILEHSVILFKEVTI